MAGIDPNNSNGATVLNGNSQNIYGMTINGTWSLYCEGYTLRNFAAGGISVDGLSNNCNFKQINVFLCGIGLNIVGIPVHYTFDTVLFQYCSVAGVKLQANSDVGDLVFNRCRFEVTSGYAWDTSLRTGAHRATFYGCVFEGTLSDKAIYLTGGATGYIFDACHFEANGVNYDPAYDIYIASGGSRNVSITNNLIGSIYVGGGAASGLRIEGNTFGPGSNPKSSYRALTVAPQAQFSSIYMNANTYYYTNPPREYIDCSNAWYVSYSNNGGSGCPDGFVADNCFAKGTTINSADTDLWKLSYFVGEHAMYIIADVWGISDDGSVSAAYTRKVLVKKATTDSSPTIIASENTTTMESNSGMDCKFVSDSYEAGRLRLLVTGLSSTNIKWRASIKVMSKNWMN